METSGFLSLTDNLGKKRLYKTYNLHVHSPSEHVFERDNQSIQYDVELHIVHARNGSNDSVQYAVLTVFFDRKHGGMAANKFIEALNLEKLHTEGVTKTVDLEELTHGPDIDKN